MRGVPANPKHRTNEDIRSYLEYEVKLERAISAGVKAIGAGQWGWAEWERGYQKSSAQDVVVIDSDGKGVLFVADELIVAGARA